MGTRLLLLYICQTVITESLGGVTLPFSDLVGNVTPIKPKPLSSSAVSSSSLLCDSKDILSKLFSPALGTQEFYSPLAITSSSRALPVPKIDSLSITDVKMPERLREKFLLPKLRNSVSNFKPDTPDESLPRKYSFISSSTKPPNALPTYSSWDMYSNSLNKISSLPNIKSLPIVPVKPLKSSDTDVICSALKINNALAQPSIIPLSEPRILDSPLTLEARKPSFSEQFNSNTFSPLTSCSSPYPLYYKSMYLPGVRTPSEMLPLNLRPISYKTADNIVFPSQPGSHNLLNPKTFTSDSSLNSLPVRNCPYLLTYMKPIKSAEIPKPINTIQLPKTPLNVPVLSGFSAQNAAAKNSGSASVASYQHPLFTEECVTNPLKYSPPKIPLVPIPTIFSGSSAYSPITFFPSQTPSTSYVNQYPSSSIAQFTANVVSSINDLVSNIAQNILSSYKTYIDSATRNVSQKPTYTIKSSPYDATEFIPEQTLPVLPLSQGKIVITEPVLPICINPPAIETSTILSSDAICESTAFDVSSNQPLLISPPQPTVTVLPPTSLITLSSPQLCPSYLPSPSLPSYPTIASPFYMEAPVCKVSSSKKYFEVEKLIELMLLAEILNNDETFDWDDLDMLLAFLSVS